MIEHATTKHSTGVECEISGTVTRKLGRGTGPEHEFIIVRCPSCGITKEYSARHKTNGSYFECNGEVIMRYEYRDSLYGE
jgi:hypothetical protein